MDEHYYVIKMCHRCTFPDSHWRQKSNLSSLTRYPTHIQLNEARVWPDAIIQCLLRYHVTDAAWATSEGRKRNHHVLWRRRVICSLYVLYVVPFLYFIDTYELKPFSNSQQLANKWGESDTLLRWRQLTTPSGEELTLCSLSWTQIYSTAVYIYSTKYKNSATTQDACVLSQSP